MAVSYLIHSVRKCDYDGIAICPIGAVYRYYESRRRILNDMKPSRKEQVAKNSKQRRNRMAQKNVSSKAASYVARALTCIGFSSCSCLREEADM